MSDAFVKQVDHLIRARYTLLNVITYEENRARNLLVQVGEQQHRPVFEWSVTEGLRQISGATPSARVAAKLNDALKVLNEILQTENAGIYVLKDFHEYLEEPHIRRQLRDLGHALRQSHKTIILLSPSLKIPEELEKAITIIDLPLPTFEELQDLLENRVLGGGNARRIQVKLNKEERKVLVKAAQGLTLAEAENAFAKAIVDDCTLDGNDISAIIEEKKQIIRKSGLLEYYDVNESMNAVGGMDLLKSWLNKRVRAFSDEARIYGLPAPKGVLLMGVQGCGKSLIAKTVAHEWRLPMLRMDMSRIFQGYIGSSEENMRRALILAESLAPMVLWIDEIEKAFSGIEGSSGVDGGTTARVIGQFLTWMQEKTAPVFVVATANSVKELPPELLRKGRLDEIFFIDLPRAKERAEILMIHLTKLKRKPGKFDLRALAEASHGFSGAEIEQALVSALHDSFFENREVTTKDITRNLELTVPLSRTMREKIAELRAWASDRARVVSSLQQYKRAEK